MHRRPQPQRRPTVLPHALLRTFSFLHASSNLEESCTASFTCAAPHVCKLACKRQRSKIGPPALRALPRTFLSLACFIELGLHALRRTFFLSCMLYQRFIKRGPSALHALRRTSFSLARCIKPFIKVVGPSALHALRRTFFSLARCINAEKRPSALIQLFNALPCFIRLSQSRSKPLGCFCTSKNNLFVHSKTAAPVCSTPIVTPGPILFLLRYKPTAGTPTLLGPCFIFGPCFKLSRQCRFCTCHNRDLNRKGVRFCVRTNLPVRG